MPPMTPPRKRSLTVAGHRTSVTLEDAFWDALVAIAAGRGESVAALIARVDKSRPADVNLSSALRMFALDWYRAPAGPT